jgi:Baseplate J-like protein
VIVRPQVLLDDRDAARVVNELFQRRLGYVPEWQPQGAGVALAWIMARYVQAIGQRLNQAPEKNKLAFLDLLGLDLVPAQAARAPIVFQLIEQAPDSRAPAGTQVAAPPPPERSDQIVFETEHALGITPAKLVEVFSLWPGRDQYIDHSAAYAAAEPFQLFQHFQLTNTPHAIYLAHDTLLALAGTARLDVEFELTQPSAEPLDILWEYWDGQVWRGFKAMKPACLEVGEEKLDGTEGLTYSGSFRLETDCAETAKTMVNDIDAFWIRGRLTEPLPVDPSKPLPEVEGVRLTSVIEQPLELVGSDKVEVEVVSGFLPDQALTDGTTVDLTKPFYPLGLQPQPGVAFYFSWEEAFSKPGARLMIFPKRTKTPQDEFDVTVETPVPIPLILPDSGLESGGSAISSAAAVSQEAAKVPLEHTLSWEYWSGRDWRQVSDLTVFPVDSSESQELSPLDFSSAGQVIELTIPQDMEHTKVSNQDGLWMRVRLVSGGFGFKQEVTWKDAENNTNRFTYVINQPPALSEFRLGYTWQYGPFHPERVLTHNDFQFEDHSDEARWPGLTFLPFRRVADVTPALYLGFDRKLPVDRLGIYVEIVEQRGETLGPALLWEYWNGAAWRELSVEDETRHLRLPGILAFIAAEDSQSLARFGNVRHWLRGRLKEDGPPGEPTVSGIFLNAVWASQQRTLSDVPLGTSSGLPDQTFIFTHTPVLPGERIEVRELTGLRANVEWRILAVEIAAGDPQILPSLEELLAREGAQLDVTYGDLRLRRDRNKRVTEVWVRWQERSHLFFSGREDRHYAIDRARGRLLFGNGLQGKIPPTGASILARQHRAGGGLFGNVAGRTITQLLGGVPGVQAVFNPRPGEGGADGETVQSFGLRGPQTVRHRGRALAPSDYETLAHEASPAVAAARAIPTRHASGRTTPGWVTLVIIPQSQDPRPWPSFGLRQQVARFIADRAPADVAAANQVYVTGPAYLPVDVSATIAPVDPAEAGAVEERARAALGEFLHPLRGGPNRHGWEIGRDVFLSDVATVLERVPGVDYVEELALLLNGGLQGDRIAVDEDHIVVAGMIRLSLKAAER